MNLDLSPRIKLGLAAAAIALTAGGAGYGIATFSHDQAADPGADASRQILYWYDPMVPSQPFDKPGNSTFMNMQLVPKNADDGHSEARVTLYPARTQSLPQHLVVARMGSLGSTITPPGTTHYQPPTVP